MNLEFLPAFVNRLEGFVELIAEDKPSAARKFHKESSLPAKKYKTFPISIECLYILMMKIFVI